MTGAVYFWLALALSTAMVWLAWRFAASRTERTARILFTFSIVYLPTIWVVMIANHGKPQL